MSKKPKVISLSAAVIDRLSIEKKRVHQITAGSVYLMK